MSLFERAYYYFEEISKIPRGSGNEKEIAAYVEAFAKEHDLFVLRDEANNVYIRKSASQGRENDLGVVLQGHLDMVCEANADVNHDFTRDPIRLIRNGDILTADGTTLGADNGVAVALMLALLESDKVSHPMLECIFTADEEAGMTGMRAFDASVVLGRQMINLDSEGEGIATVSCAGGVRTVMTLSADRRPIPERYKIAVMSIKGLFGGHSGADIHLGRANAIKLAARLLYSASYDADVRIVSITGGSKDNAIPRECTVTFATDSIEKVRTAMEREAASLPLTENDKGFRVTVEPSCEQATGSLMYSDALLRLLCNIPYGILGMSRGIPGLVETSANLGVIRTDEAEVRITVSSRSSVEGEIDGLEQILAQLCENAGGTWAHKNRYPGWEYKEGTALQKKYLNTFRDLYGREATVVGIHAGLECGLFMQKVPDMDIIAIGPEVVNLHSPDETLYVSTYERLAGLIEALLR